MRQLLMSITAAVVAALLLAAGSACAQDPDQSIDEALKKEVIEKLSQRLIERYVFPDIGKQCAEHVTSKYAAGAFSDFNRKKEFADALTKELQSISKDKHMRVRVQPPMRMPEGGPADPLVRDLQMQRMMAADNFGFSKVEILENNIGYLDIRFFPPVELAKPTASAAMRFVANVDALIVDLRQNGGGNPTTIQYICSYFFGEKTHLNSLYWREGDRLEEFWTLDEVEGVKMPNVPLFVLTSNRTFSGGEEFANNLKTRKRAILIGETTGGGANPGGGFPLAAGIGVFIPTGRAINPVTKTNWEGTGVVPDISVDSAGAMTVALEKAKPAAAEYRAKREETASASVREVRAGLKKSSELFASKKNDAADAEARKALELGYAKGILNEFSVNMLGYEYLEEKNYELAIAVFKVNVAKFPDSWNVYDSLGEAYMKSGNNELAIANYKKSLTLNPENGPARENIKKMGGKP